MNTRRWVVLVAAVLTVLLTARLGWWQLDRAHQKQALQDQLDARVAEPALSARGLTANPEVAPTLHHRLVRLRGHWLPGRTVFLDNRQMHGRPGFFVMSAFALVDSGPAPGSSPMGDKAAAPTVLVQRGWVPRDNDNRTKLPALADPSGDIELIGRVAPPPARLYEFATDASGPIRQNLKLDALSTEWGLQLLPLTIVQTEPPVASPDGLQRDWPRPAVDIHKHYGYAAQWFALAALTTGLYVWFQLLRPRRRRGPAD